MNLCLTFSCCDSLTGHLSGELGLQLLLAGGQSIDVFLLTPDEVRGQRLSGQQKTGQNRQSGHLQRLCIGAPAGGATEQHLKHFSCLFVWVLVIFNQTVICLPQKVSFPLSMGFPVMHDVPVLNHLRSKGFFFFPI